MSTRREPTAEQKRRMKKLIAIESAPEAISANRAKVQKIRQNQNIAQQTPKSVGLIESRPAPL